MPGTVNGIGTNYYFKKNLRKERGVCEHCKRQTELQTYETRLWVCVLFIPIIPLGRKQIVDYCTACTWHHALPLDKYKALGEEAIAEGMEDMNREPDSPDAAVKMHQALTTFGKHEEARRLMGIMETKFGNDVDILMYLGAWHDKEGRGKEADACFAKALAVAPDHKGAKRAVGIGYIEQGDLDRAHGLLAFVKTPGEDFDPAVLFMLARAHQEKGEHARAIELHRLILEGDPKISQDKAMRQAVKTAERALNRQQSILPPKRINYAAVIGIPAVAVTIVLAIVGFSRYRATHQTLHVINHLGMPATVDIPGHAPLTLRPGAHERIKMAEGKHQAKVQHDGGEPETVAFRIENTWGQRMGNKSVFVLNAGGGAVVVWEEIEYRTHAKNDPYHPYRLHVGKAFLTFRDIDHIFENFPQTISMEGSSEMRSRVGVMEGPPAEMVSFLHRSGDVKPPDLVEYAESHLRATPGNEPLLQLYTGLGAVAGADRRVHGFLAAGLARRPVEIEWHRMYQTAAVRSGKDADVQTRYEAMLAEEPDNAALLYLCGRLGTDGKRSLELFDRAIAADPEMHYPVYAKSYHYAARGEFDKAVRLCRQARALKPDDAWMGPALTGFLFLQGDYERVTADMRKELEVTPLNAAAVNTLVQALAAQGKLGEADKEQKAYAARVKQEMPGDPLQLALTTRTVYCYEAERFSEMLGLARKLSAPASRSATAFAAHVELGDLDAATGELDSKQMQSNGYMELLLAIAYEQSGQSHNGATWRERARKELANGSEEARAVAALLEAPQTLTPKVLDDLTMSAGDKAAVYVAMAQLRPDLRPTLLARARRFAGLPAFPHHFLLRTIAAMEK